MMARRFVETMAALPHNRPPQLREKAQLMSASEVERTLVRLAHEIVEKNNGVQDIVLVGVRRRGVFLAERLAKLIRQIERAQVPVGTLDITLYRDDLTTVAEAPRVKKTQMECAVGGKDVVLVDDVLYTGRTTRAALNELFDYGRPASVQLVVLADRGERELPVAAQYCIWNVELAEGESLTLSRDDAGKLAWRLENV
jgi:pyrimidine operon attenuation protein/uracil phosphoribosyltransferase